MRKYAIIGKGFIYERHVKAIEETGGILVTDCDINPSLGADYTDFRAMLRGGKYFDTVVICTPNHLHAEMARACLDAGKEVLCEKPLNINTDFHGLEDVNIVLQLRYHPAFNKICSAMKKGKEIKIVLRAIRDDHFWRSWKGDEMLSGGVAYIMGSHLFDIVAHALGNSYKILSFEDGMKKSCGKLQFGDKIVTFDMEFLDNRETQGRSIEIDGKTYTLSLQDNLSFEGLHDKVYEALNNGTAPKLKDTIDSIRMIDAVKKF